MAFDLSFSEEFFADCLEAIEKKPLSWKIDLCIEVYGYDRELATIAAQTETLPHDILDTIRETNTCTDLRSPVEVWIDEEGFWTIDVH